MALNFVRLYVSKLAPGEKLISIHNNTNKTKNTIINGAIHNQRLFTGSHSGSYKLTLQLQSGHSTAPKLLFNWMAGVYLWPQIGTLTKTAIC